MMQEVQVVDGLPESTPAAIRKTRVKRLNDGTYHPENN